jgi:hypothetical protein
MNQQPDHQAQPQVVSVAAGLAYVCRYLKDICEVLRPDSSDHGQRDPLEVRHVADAVRTGADLRGPLEALHTSLQVAGDPRGVWSGARALMMTGLATDVPFEPVYSCPHDHCSGHSVTTATAISFTCTLTHQPLRKEAL